MKRYIQGESRTQSTLFPERIDDYIHADNDVRIIDAFVDHLDLHELGFERAIPSDTGRPSYHPGVLLKLYIYGYLNRIQSTRRLEKESQRNVELMWLTERLCPDFKTLADFRRNNADGIKNTCKTFVMFCRELGMFSNGTVAVDGSKFKASNNKENNFTPKKLDFHIKRLERQISEYLMQMDASDLSEQSQDQRSTQDKIDWLKSRLDHFESLKTVVDATEDKQLSTVDPDSRIMKVKGMVRQVGYNVQSAVDTKHHMIVAHEVTNKPSDRGLLYRTAKLAQDALEITDLTILADKGYYSGIDIKDTMDAGMHPLVPKGDTSAAEKKGIFNRSVFRYDKENDQYICPEDQALKYRMTSVEKGKEQRKYWVNDVICRECPLKSQCTNSKGSRRISRWAHENVLEEMQNQLSKDKLAMLYRKQTVEHPFGTIKTWVGSQHFLTRGLKHVSTEMNLNVLAYNLRRMISIYGVQELIQKFKIRKSLLS